MSVMPILVTSSMVRVFFVLSFRLPLNFSARNIVAMVYVAMRLGPSRKAAGEPLTLICGPRKSIAATIVVARRKRFAFSFFCFWC